MVALPTTVLITPLCDKASPVLGAHRKGYLFQSSGQGLLRICLTRASVGGFVDFFEVRARASYLHTLSLSLGSVWSKWDLREWF